jgi:hypothetical protein
MTVNEVVDQDTPVDHIPHVTGEHPGSIGDDVNLPLLVRELGGRKKLKLSKRRQQLLKELDTIDKELMQLDVLLDAAEKL